jgi:hypothetical protein
MLRLRSNFPSKKYALLELLDLGQDALGTGAREFSHYLLVADKLKGWRSATKLVGKQNWVQ